MKKNLKNIVLASLFLSLPLGASIKDDIKSMAGKSKSSFIKSTYSTNLYDPIWIKGNALSTLGEELMSQIKNDKTFASDLPFYKLYKSVKSDLKSAKIDASTELKLMKLYKAYMDYLIKGGINWKKFDREIARLKKKYDYNVGWERVAPPYSSKKILTNAILSNTFGNSFSKVEPKRFKYKKLKNYLAKYIAIKNSGGWPVVKSAKTLKVGSSSPAIPKIRKRLKIVGDLGNCGSSMDSTVYDKCMAKAVKRFRLRHGLKASSVIDKSTRKELSKPISYYIKKMRLNLDRIKWLKRDEARVRIELNIPAFRLYVYDGKGLVTTMRVITGKPDHPTPIFSDVMTTIVVNPYWRIPESIVRNEMLKHLIKDPHHYERQHKYLYKGWGPNSEKINPATVNWKQYKGNKKHIPYHFMQEPGSRNALGKIKFLFPNKYSVYIHDTPGKRYFFRDVRALSHGCMRIQKPRELLEALALYNSNVHVDNIMKRLGTNDNKQIGLRRRIPVDITYLTSFVDDYGNLHFRRDIYGYDRLQLKGYLSSKGFKIDKESKKSKSKKHKKYNTEKKDKVTKKAKKEPKVKKETEVKKVTKKPKKVIKHKKVEKKVNKEVKKSKAVVKNKKGYEIIEVGY